jgi:hypothetical protein
MHTIYVLCEALLHLLGGAGTLRSSQWVRGGAQRGAAGCGGVVSGALQTYDRSEDFDLW